MLPYIELRISNHGAQVITKFYHV